MTRRRRSIRFVCSTSPRWPPRTWRRWRRFRRTRLWPAAWTAWRSAAPAKRTEVCRAVGGVFWHRRLRSDVCVCRRLFRQHARARQIRAGDLRAAALDRTTRQRPALLCDLSTATRPTPWMPTSRCRRTRMNSRERGVGSAILNPTAARIRCRRLLFALSLRPDAIYFLSDGKFDPGDDARSAIEKSSAFAADTDSHDRVHGAHDRGADADDRAQLRRRVSVCEVSELNRHCGHELGAEWQAKAHWSMLDEYRSTRAVIGGGDGFAAGLAGVGQKTPPATNLEARDGRA